MDTHPHTEAANTAIRICHQMQDNPDLHRLYKIKTALITSNGSVFYVTDSKRIFRMEDGGQVFINIREDFIRHLKFFIAVKATKMRVFTRMGSAQRIY